MTAVSLKLRFARTSRAYSSAQTGQARAGEIPVVTVLNKCDKLTENIPVDDKTVKISALKGEGM